MPGIGKVYGDGLRAAGFYTAQSVLNEFLALGKDQISFMQWLKKTCGANAKSQQDCYSALNEWCSMHCPHNIEPYSTVLPGTI